MSIARTRNLRLSLTDDELRKAHELAEAEGTTVTALLRRYLAKAHAKVVASKSSADASEKR